MFVIYLIWGKRVSEIDRSRRDLHVDGLIFGNRQKNHPETHQPIKKSFLKPSIIFLIIYFPLSCRHPHQDLDLGLKFPNQVSIPQNVGSRTKKCQKIHPRTSPLGSLGPIGRLQGQLDVSKVDSFGSHWGTLSSLCPSFGLIWPAFGGALALFGSPWDPFGPPWGPPFSLQAQCSPFAMPVHKIKPPRTRHGSYGGATGAMGTGEVVSRTAARSPPPTCARGQDDGS